MDPCAQRHIFREGLYNLSRSNLVSRWLNYAVLDFASMQERRIEFGVEAALVTNDINPYATNGLADSFTIVPRGYRIAGLLFGCSMRVEEKSRRF